MFNSLLGRAELVVHLPANARNRREFECKFDSSIRNCSNSAVVNTTSHLGVDQLVEEGSCSPDHTSAGSLPASTGNGQLVLLIAKNEGTGLWSPRGD